MSVDTAVTPLRKLGFNHIVPLTRDDPARGFREAIELFRFAEELGFDSGTVRTRHLQYGLPSSSVFFGAVSQHTSRIQLGTAVIPVEFENPFRLAEDLATADILTGGRLQPGLSVHGPRYAEEVNDLVFDSGWREQEYGYARIERLRDLLRGAPVREIAAYEGFGGQIDSERVEPHSPGLANRLWYGAGSLKSARWAGESGLNLLVSNISSAEEGITDFALAQRAQIDAYRAAGGQAGTVAQARVVVPTEGATDEQAARYRAHVAERTPRTREIHGRNTIIAVDFLGSTGDIVQAVSADAGFQAADQFIVELPFEFGFDDWRHILEQVATRIAPELGWEPGR